MGRRRGFRFEDRELERAFRHDHARATRILHRFAGSVALTGWCAIGLIDPEIGGTEENLRVLSLMRYGVVAPLVALGLAWSFVPERLYQRTQEWVMVGMVSAMIIGIAIMIGLMPHPEMHRTDQAGSGLLLIVLGAGTLAGLRCVPTLLAIVPTTALYVSVVATVYPDSLLTSCVWLGVAAVASGVASYLFESLRRRNWLASRELARERERSEALLRNVLPEAIAERLKREPGRIAEHFPAATVLFADLVGFTSLAERVPRRSSSRRSMRSSPASMSSPSGSASRRSRPSATRTWSSAACRLRATTTPRRSPRWRWRCVMRSTGGRRWPVNACPCGSASQPARWWPE